MGNFIMSNSLNKVTLIGYVGQDPEVRSSSDGREIVVFSVATSESWNDKGSGERKERTEWHRIVVFSTGLVGVAKNYLKKGSKVYIEGALQTRKWQDQAGNDKYTTEIVMQNYGSSLIMLDRADAPASANNFTPSPMMTATNRQDGSSAAGAKFGTLEDSGGAAFVHEEIHDSIPW